MLIFRPGDSSRMQIRKAGIQVFRKSCCFAINLLADELGSRVTARDGLVFSYDFTADFRLEPGMTRGERIASTAYGGLAMTPGGNVMGCAPLHPSYDFYTFSA